MDLSTAIRYVDESFMYKSDMALIFKPCVQTRDFLLKTTGCLLFENVLPLFQLPFSGQVSVKEVKITAVTISNNNDQRQQ